MKKELNMLNLYKGSPRELSSHGLKDFDTIPGAGITIKFSGYTKFDCLKEFIPQNNLVTP